MKIVHGVYIEESNPGVFMDLQSTTGKVLIPPSNKRERVNVGFNVNTIQVGDINLSMGHSLFTITHWLLNIQYLFILDDVTKRTKHYTILVCITQSHLYPVLNIPPFEIS